MRLVRWGKYLEFSIEFPRSCDTLLWYQIPLWPRIWPWFEYWGLIEMSDSDSQTLIGCYELGAFPSITLFNPYGNPQDKCCHSHFMNKGNEREIIRSSQRHTGQLLVGLGLDPNFKRLLLQAPSTLSFCIQEPGFPVAWFLHWMCSLVLVQFPFNFTSTLTFWLSISVWFPWWQIPQHHAEVWWLNLSQRGSGVEESHFFPIQSSCAWGCLDYCSFIQSLNILETVCMNKETFEALRDFSFRSERNVTLSYFE